ncbi:MAG: tryptophan--tRNA ligase [Chitinophagaceae bacterium]|nr:MAG: tryptophan--tRNA ligase [Chitinophagaceae bacterium]
METVVSGVRPTGRLHLGNYFGAVKNFVKLQESYKTFFFIADYHSLTTHPKSGELKQNVSYVLSEYLACGLDPEKTVLYLQSDIPEIAELYLIFNMIAYKGELERCTTYKDKVSKQQENINAGLLTYPVLMAIDIIIHKANKVPVGKDQIQHLEMTRNFVKRFHHLYNCEVFPEPQAFNFSEELVKVPGLDGSGKMGKSEGPGNAIYLVEDPGSIKKKVMRAVTDAGPTEPDSPLSEPIKNIFDIMSLVSDESTKTHFINAYKDCSIRYGDLKKQLAEDIINFTNPIRQRITDIQNDKENLQKILKQGQEKARESASKTLKEVKETIGIGSI